MTLPDQEVLDLLDARFVVGFKNIERAGHVGMSHGYKPTQCAVGTTNGAGGRNVQMVVLAADGTVLHVLPGFWHAEDLIDELLLALEVHSLHEDKGMHPSAKQKMFATLHRVHMRRHVEDSKSRSGWQDFDQSAEFARASTETRDTIASMVPPVMKPITQVVHERMLQQPFKQLGEFDMDAFVDYGRAYYDNNAGFDKGQAFRRAEQANAKREREREKEQKEAAKAAAKASRTSS